MKKIKFLSLAVGLLSFIIFQAKAQDNMKRYHVESGKVIYQIHSPGGSGTKTLIFDQYGRRESVHETVQKNGKTVKDQLTLLNNGKAYTVDLLHNTGMDISGRTGMAMGMAAAGGGNDMAASGKKMLETMGGRMVGHQNFLGKDCEKWELNTMGKTSLLIWKGLTLKTETSVMGMKTSETATSVKTGMTFANADFQPPAGVKMETPQMQGMGGMQMSDDDKAQMKKLMNMPYADFKAQMKKDNPSLTDQEIQQAYKMMKQMGKFIK